MLEESETAISVGESGERGCGDVDNPTNLLGLCTMLVKMDSRTVTDFCLGEPLLSELTGLTLRRVSCLEAL